MTTPSTSTSVTTRYDSAWSPSVLATLQADTAPPPTPSAPLTARLTTTSGRFLWNGFGAFGETMPADLDAVELHLSTSASYTSTSPADRLAGGYTLASDTYRGDVVGGRPFDVQGLVSGTTYFASLVARDLSGNRSGQSAIVSV